MLGTMFDLANRGIDVLRLDAVPFLWKRLGTDCQNQPEAHLLIQAFRALTRLAAPGLALKAHQGTCAATTTSAPVSQQTHTQAVNTGESLTPPQSSAPTTPNS